MGNSCGAVPSYDAVEMDDAARGRLVRALRAGVSGSALESRFGRLAASLKRMAREAGWDGTVTGNCALACGRGQAGTPVGQREAIAGRWW